MKRNLLCGLRSTSLSRNLLSRSLSCAPLIRQELSTRHMPVLSLDSINQAVVRAEYAVRGELAIKAEKLKSQLADDPKAKETLGFDQVISANIGNPQQLGQKGLTYLRQVRACAVD